MAVKQTEPKNNFKQFSRFVFGAFFAFLLVVVLFAVGSPLRRFLLEEKQDGTQTNPSDSTPSVDDEPSDSPQDENPVIYPYRLNTILTEVERDNVTAVNASSFISDHIALLKSDNGEMALLASLNADERIHPASMTKVMTLLVAAEHVTSLEDEVPVKGELFDQYADLLKGTEQFVSYKFDKKDNMTVPVKTLMYLIGMESAADATLVLTDYLAGSHETFVAWMNQKAQDLQLRDTHFTNAIGIYDENLYSTALDMAVIMANAMQVDILTEILGTEEAGLPFELNGAKKNFWPKHTLFFDFYSKNTSYSRKPAAGYYVAAAKTGTESYQIGKKETVYIKALVSMTTDERGGHYILVTVSESSSGAVLKDLVSDLNVMYQNAATYMKQ